MDLVKIVGAYLAIQVLQVIELSTYVNKPLKVLSGQVQFFCLTALLFRRIFSTQKIQLICSTDILDLT